MYVKKVSFKMLKESFCYKTLLLLLILIVDSGIQICAAQNNLKASVPNYFVEVDLNLYIAKIYDIDLVTESYKIDGYIEYLWFDERLIYDARSSSTFLIYENEEAQDLLRSEIWFPILEFINIQGNKELYDTKITIRPDGKVIYKEHFSGIFHTEMQSKKFPFDSKNFLIEIEPFSHSQEKLRFQNALLLPKNDSLMNLNLESGWVLTNTGSRIDSAFYQQNLEVESNPFSKIIFEVKAKRVHKYYVWHILIPILMITLLSFIVFWIPHYRAQIVVGMITLLAMIALTLYSAPDIPKLPYNTFIEYMFIIGILFILLGIIAVVADHRLLKKRHSKLDLLKICRTGLPLTFLLTLAVISNFIF